MLLICPSISQSAERSLDQRKIDARGRAEHAHELMEDRGEVAVSLGSKSRAVDGPLLRLLGEPYDVSLFLEKRFPHNVCQECAIQGILWMKSAEWHCIAWRIVVRRMIK